MHLLKMREAVVLIGAAMWTLSGSALSADPIPTTDPTGNTPVATVKGHIVEYTELESSIQAKLNQQQQLHDAQLQQINASFARTRRATMLEETGRYVDNKVLELEAAAQKTTPAALLAAVKPASVTDAQVESFYNERAGRIGQPLANVAPRIKELMNAQNSDKAQRQYLDSLREKYHASVTMEPLREQVAAIGPARGPTNAQITIVEFSDFQCPFCGQFEPELKKLMEAYPTQVRLIYRNMPIPSLHPEAQKAAEAAICADKQGKFWEMHDTLFSEQSALAPAALEEKARRLGLDSAAFDTCLQKGEAVAALNVDLREAERLGLDSTPVTFINGRIVPGAIGYDELVGVIKDELQKQAHPVQLNTSASNH